MRPEQTMHALFSHGQSICGRLQYAVAHVRKEKGKNKPQKLLHVLCTVRVTGSRFGTTRRGVEREAARPRNLVFPKFPARCQISHSLDPVIKLIPRCIDS